VPRKIETHFVSGPVGRLEALLEEPDDQAPREVALVCHPHPQYGGTMHNKVVYRLARGLRRSGHVVLRFNYRGVNLSEGSYGHGDGELEDARTALEWLRSRYPELPYMLAGFSFGSRVVLRLGCQLRDVQRVIAAGFPTNYGPQSYLTDCTLDKIFIQSTHDEYGPVHELQEHLKAVHEPKRLILIEAEDHYFKGALQQLEDSVAGVA
jgi:alpha/beta superfamily hydrolase